MSRRCRAVEPSSEETFVAERKNYRIDLLQIDTEGFDYEVMKTVPFRHVRPRVIVYEEKILGKRDRSARRSSAEHLIATKALRCTATAWMLIVAQSFAKF